MNLLFCPMYYKRVGRLSMHCIGIKRETLFCYAVYFSRALFSFVENAVHPEVAHPHDVQSPSRSRKNTGQDDVKRPVRSVAV